MKSSSPVISDIRLLRHPAIKPGTSLAGYCWVLDEANAPFGAASLAAALGLHIDALTSAPDAPSILAAASGQSEQVIRHASLCSSAPVLPGTSKSFALCGHAVDGDQLVVGATRLCGKCLTDGIPHLAEFELKAMTCCRRHGVWLSDRCYKCLTPFEHGRTSQRYCSCGAFLPAMPLHHAPSAVVAISNWALSNVPSLRGHSLDSEDLPPVTRLDAALAVTAKLGSSLGVAEPSVWRDPTASGQLCQIRDEIIASAFCLTNWPRNVSKLIEHRIARQGQYGRVWTAIDSMRQLAFEVPYGEDLKFLQEVASRCVRNAGRWHAPSPHSAVKFGAAASQDHEVLEAADVRDLLRINSHELDQIVQAGILSTVSHPRKSALRSYLIRKSDVDSLLSSLSPRSTFELAGHSKTVQAIAFKSARNVVNILGPTLPTLLNSIADQKTFAVRQDPRQRGLSAIAVDYDRLTEYLLSTEQLRSGVPLKEVHPILQISKGMAQDIARLGMFGELRDGIVKCDALREFLRMYVFPGRVSVALGVPKSALVRAFAEHSVSTIQLHSEINLKLFIRKDVDPLVREFRLATSKPARIRI